MDTTGPTRDWGPKFVRREDPDGFTILIYALDGTEPSMNKNVENPL